MPDILTGDLVNLSFPPRFVKFINNLIASRNIQFVIQGDLSPPYTSRKGTPQGSVLSLTLFNIYLRDINSSLASNSLLLQFADDIVIFASDSHLGVALISVERSLNNLHFFLTDRSLEISPDKTRMMIFSKKKGQGPLYSPGEIREVKHPGFCIGEIPQHRAGFSVVGQDAHGIRM